MIRADGDRKIPRNPATRVGHRVGGDVVRAQPHLHAAGVAGGVREPDPGPDDHDPQQGVGDAGLAPGDAPVAEYPEDQAGGQAQHDAQGG